MLGKIMDNPLPHSGATLLAVGIPAAGIAYASPAQYLNMNKPAATQQMNQNANPMAGTAQQQKMTPGTHGPANSSMMQSTASDSTDNSKAPGSMPMVDGSPSMAHDPAQMNQMEPNHQPAMAAGHQAQMGPGADGSGRGEGPGYGGSNGKMQQGNGHPVYGGEHGGNGMRNHK